MTRIRLFSSAADRVIEVYDPRCHGLFSSKGQKLFGNIDGSPSRFLRLIKQFTDGSAGLDVFLAHLDVAKDGCGTCLIDIADEFDFDTSSIRLAL